ncbi:MAG: glycine oxidase ThiO [Solirubrobacteraceae bacterium]
MPKSNSQATELLIVGGGVIGLSVAWRARCQGLSVLLLERESLGQGASHVAAGMLAPVAEVEFGSSARRVLELGLRSAAMWPAFARELEELSSVTVGLRQTGTLVLARDDDEARELERQSSLRDSLGLRTSRLLSSQARELEPALAPTLRLALESPDDHSVDPRLVIEALCKACQLNGVMLREHTAVAAIDLDGAGRLRGVRLHDGEFLRAERVLIAAGAWSAQLAGLPDDARAPVHPVKGQILRLRDPAGAGLLERVVRFQGGYIVPRGDGNYVLGATMEERGFDRSPTAGGVYELLRDAHELVPGVSELEVVELGVGLRPGTPDNKPVIGPSSHDGLMWASGHHRNGILLAPLTAELILAALADGQEPNPLAQACDPMRFGKQHHLQHEVVKAAR